jgi:hypothetical protein
LGFRDLEICRKSYRNLFLVYFSGASLDGIYKNFGVEVKCPSTIWDKHPEQDIDEILDSFTPSQRYNFCLEKRDGRVTLKRDHKFFTQIQIQMFVSGLRSTYFLV